MTSFIHLHRHSDMSPLDGAGTSWQFAERVAELGQSYLAQTDHGNINGALKHMKACEEFGIIPIQGVEGYWRPNRMVRSADWRFLRWHMILLAINLKGWHNLIKITSEAFASGFYQSPCFDWELLEQYQEGLVCSASCALGPVSYLLENSTDAAVDGFMERALKIFGADRFCLEIMPHDWDRQRSLNIAHLQLANKWGVRCHATVDSHYVDPDMYTTQKIIALMATNTTVAEAEEKNRQRIANGDEVYELGHPGLHLMSGDEVRDRFIQYHPDIPIETVDRSIGYTLDIAQMVKPYMINRSLKMPRMPKGIDPEQELIAWCREGMDRIGRTGDEAYERQLEYELSIIRARNNFAYMWIVGDLVRWAKSDSPLPSIPEDAVPPNKKPIRLGPGRGSAAGSLVCYLSGITGIDPITHKLKFERFMNPGRKGIPDIDLDFESVKVAGHNRRPECKEYLARKHGRGAVADVVSYSTFQPRAALNDVSRILGGVDYQELKAAVNLIDPVHDQDLEEMRVRMPQLDALANNYPEMWMHAVRLENKGNAFVSRMGKHAGGVVIVPGGVAEHMATVKASEEETGQRTAWSETPQISICDDFGFLKIDVLGVSGIARQQMALDSIREIEGKTINIDALPTLADPYDVDPAVMRVFQEGLTLGVNQFGSANMISFLRQLSPDNLIDLAAANALFRPGPIGGGAPWTYAKRKSGEEEWTVPKHLDGILTETYGVMPFQESVMAIFQAVLGYSAGQADDVRKEIDKLNRAHSQEGRRRLAERKDDFVIAATKAFGAEYAERLWSDIVPFTGYSFNRAHATGYAIQAYQDAWLKRYYPTHFYAALLTTDSDYAFAAAREARAFNVRVLPPDINLSAGGFTVDHENGALRYGLSGIKGVGDAAAAQVMKDRPFASHEDFTQRSSRKYSKVNKGSREKLERVGALDCFGVRAEWDPIDRARAELELLGVALEPGGLLGGNSSVVWEHVSSELEVSTLEKGVEVTVGGTITEIKLTTVKRGKQSGQEMAFVTVSLDLDSWRLTWFPDSWASRRELIIGCKKEEQMIIVRGKKDDRGGIISHNAMRMDEFIEQISNKVAA